MHFVILEYNLTFTGKIKIWRKSFSTKRDGETTNTIGIISKSERYGSGIVSNKVNCIIISW